MIEVAAIDAKYLVALCLRKFKRSVVRTRIHNQNLAGWEALKTQSIAQTGPVLTSVTSWDDHPNLRRIDGLIDGEIRSKHRRHGTTPFHNLRQLPHPRPIHADSNHPEFDRTIDRKSTRLNSSHRCIY